MTFVAEAAFIACSMCATSPLRRGQRHRFSYISSPGEEAEKMQLFELADSMNLESWLEVEIGSLPGVRDVAVERLDTVFTTNVLVESLEFEIFEPIAEQDLKISTEFPQYTFRLNVTPLLIAEGMSSFGARG